MRHLEKEGLSINGSLHVVQVIDQFSFYIGNTLEFAPYEGDGTVRNIKTPKKLAFRPLAEAAVAQNIDPNLQYYDFAKGAHLNTLHLAFIALGAFRGKHGRLPGAWSKEDAGLLI
jgi:ubiquitin-activating enzyme E1